MKTQMVITTIVFILPLIIILILITACVSPKVTTTTLDENENLTTTKTLPSSISERILNTTTTEPATEPEPADILSIEPEKPPIIAWETTFGGEEKDWGISVQPTSDGGYIITGFTASSGAGKSDVWVIKTDAEGNKLWDKAFGGVEDDELTTAQPTPDGGYILAG